MKPFTIQATGLFLLAAIISFPRVALADAPSITTYYQVCENLATGNGIQVPWTAKVLFSAFQAETATYPGSPSPVAFSIQQRCDAAAWLAEQLLDANDAATANDISYAIWQIFDFTAINGLGSGDQQQVMEYMETALDQNYNVVPPPGVYIYTPSPPGSQGVSGLRPEIPVPEASTLTHAAFDLVGLAAILIVVRRLIRWHA